MLSYCQIQKKEGRENESDNMGRYESQDTSDDNVITDYKRDCIYCDCSQCSVIYFQDALC